MFSFSKFHDSVKYSWYKVLIKPVNSAFDFMEKLSIDKSTVHSACEVSLLLQGL